MRKTFRSTRMLTIGLLALFLLWSCGGGGDGGSGGGTAAATATVSGFVTGSGGLPGVAVTGGGASATTDSNGYFSMDVTVPSNNRVTLNFSLAGKVPTSRVVDVSANGDYTLSLAMKAPTASIAVDLSTTDAADISDTGEHKMTISGLQDAVGNTGNVTMDTFYGDPTSADDLEAFPGDFMAAQPADDGSVGDGDIVLESVVFTDITITDGSGEEIHELNDWVRIELRLPDDLQDDYAEGDYIPWWSFDKDEGIWVQEDAFPDTHAEYAASVQADGFSHALIFAHATETFDNGVSQVPALYALAYASHLSWWNVDAPVNERAVICVDVVDEEDNPMPNISVEAKGVTYQSFTYGTTDSEGRACITVKRTMDPQNPERVTVHGRLGSVNKTYDVTSATEGDVAMDQVFNPSASGSTIGNVNEDNWVLLENKLVLGYDGMIQGTVTYQDSGQAANGVKVITSVGVTATTNSNGYYEMKVPQGDIIVAATGAPSQAVTVGTSPETVDFVIPNQAPVIDTLTANPGLTVDSGATVTFNASASDPDGDSVTYAWTASAGTPASGSGTRFAWQAPSGTGSAIITLTVSDDKGKTATDTRTVTYGGQVGGTALKVTVKDDWESDSPMEGVYVVLHGTDNTSVAQYKVTGTDGVADFGDIGRTQVTVTIAYEFTGGYNIQRFLTTLVDVPTADFVYYLEFDQQQVETTPDQLTVNLDWGTGGPPQDTYYVSSDDPFGSSYNWDSLDAFTANLYPADIQTDELFSILVGGFDMDDSLLRYGYLMDQTVDTVNPYTVQMDQTPSLLSWTSGFDIHQLEISGMYKGLEHTLGEIPYNSNGINSGTLSWAENFPAEAFIVYAGVDSMDSYRSTILTQTSIPSSLTIPASDMSFTSTDYNAATGVFTWALSGTADIVNPSLEGYDDGGTTNAWVYWSGILDPASHTSWTVPGLPTPIADWLSGITPSGGFMAEDYSTFTGFDQVVAAYLSGTDPFASNGQYFSLQLWTNHELAGVSATAAEGEDSEKSKFYKNRFTNLLRR